MPWWNPLRQRSRRLTWRQWFWSLPCGDWGGLCNSRGRESYLMNRNSNRRGSHDGSGLPWLDAPNSNRWEVGSGGMGEALELPWLDLHAQRAFLSISCDARDSTGSRWPLSFYRSWVPWMPKGGRRRRGGRWPGERLGGETEALIIKVPGCPGWPPNL